MTSEPTEREKKNWELFYEVMEQYTKEHEGTYFGGSAQVCLIGLTGKGLKDNGDSCFIEAKSHFESGSSISYAPDVLALAKCYHLHPGVIDAIYISAAGGRFRYDLGDSLIMARAILEESEKEGLTWKDWEQGHYYDFERLYDVPDLLFSDEDEDEG